MEFEKRENGALASSDWGIISIVSQTPIYDNICQDRCSALEIVTGFFADAVLE